VFAHLLAHVSLISAHPEELHGRVSKGLERVSFQPGNSSGQPDPFEVLILFSNIKGLIGDKISILKGLSMKRLMYVLLSTALIATGTQAMDYESQADTAAASDSVAATVLTGAIVGALADNKAQGVLANLDSQVAVASVLAAYSDLLPNRTDLRNLAVGTWKAMCGGCGRVKKVAHSRYWKHKIIPDNCNDKGVISVFDPAEEDIICTTSDGYDFIIPVSVVGKNFLGEISTHVYKERMHPGFAALVKQSAKASIFITSGVFYTLCIAKNMQIKEQEIDLKCAVHLLKESELFDLIRALGILKITDKDLVRSVYEAVAEVLFLRYPYWTVDSAEFKITMNVIERGLKLEHRARKKLIKVFTNHDNARSTAGDCIESGELIIAPQPVEQEPVLEESSTASGSFVTAQSGEQSEEAATVASKPATRKSTRKRKK
jgi:hypothetical protein